MTLINNFASKSVIFEMLPNIGNIDIYHFEAFFSTIKNLGSLPLKSPPFGLDRALKASHCTKNEEFFRQLSMVDLDMDGKLSPRAVEWRWNHDDPTARSSKV